MEVKLALHDECDVRGLQPTLDDLGHTLFTHDQDLLYDYAVKIKTAADPKQVVEQYVRIICATRKLAMPAPGAGPDPNPNPTPTPTPNPNPNPNPDQAACNDPLIIAASNALSILSYAHVCSILELHSLWVHQDWSRIRVPYANLNMSTWYGCSFDDADLSHVTMFSATFHCCSFRRANLNEATLLESKTCDYDQELPLDIDHRVEFSQKGDRIAVIPRDGQPLVGDAATLRLNPLTVQEEDSSLVLTVAAFSPNGQYLAVGSENNRVFVWDMTTIHPKTVIRPDRFKSTHTKSLVWSPDGVLLAVGAARLRKVQGDYDTIRYMWTGALRIWDVSQLERPRTVCEIDLPYRALAISPDGRKLAANLLPQDPGYTDLPGTPNAIHVWDISNLDAPQRLFALQCPGKPVSLCISEDGLKLATFYKLGEFVRIWCLTTGKILYDSKVEAIQLHGQTLRRADADYYGLRFEPTLPDSTEPHDSLQLTETLNDAGLNIWKMLPTRVRVGLPVLADGHRLSKAMLLACSPQDGRLAALSYDQQFQMSTIQLRHVLSWTSTLRRHLLMQNSHSAQLYRFLASETIILSQDGMKLFFATPTHIIAWDLQRGAKLGELSWDRPSSTAHESSDMPLMADERSRAVRDLGGEEEKVDKLVSYEVSDASDPSDWSDDESVSANGNLALRVYDWAVSTDGGYFVATQRNALYMWDLTTSKLKLFYHQDWRADKDIFGSVAISHDNSRIAILNYLGELAYVISVETGQKTHQIVRRSRRSFKDLAFSPDGNHLALVTYSCQIPYVTLEIVNLTTGTRATVWRHRGSYVGSVAYSPSGLQVLVGGPGRDLNVSNTKTNSLEMKLMGHTRSVTQARYSTTGEFIISSGYDNTVRLWHVATRRCVQVISCPSSITHFALSPRAPVLVVATNRLLYYWSLDFPRDEEKASMVGASQRSHLENEANDGETSSNLKPSASLVKIVGLSTLSSFKDSDFHQAKLSNNLYDFK